MLFPALAVASSAQLKVVNTPSAYPRHSHTLVANADQKTDQRLCSHLEHRPSARSRQRWRQRRYSQLKRALVNIFVMPSARFRGSDFQPFG